MDNSLYGRFMRWWHMPYSDNMDVTHWFLFLGLIGVLTFLWSMVIATIKHNVE